MRLPVALENRRAMFKSQEHIHFSLKNTLGSILTNLCPRCDKLCLTTHSSRSTLNISHTLHTKMNPKKRKADAAESSGESPHKRARSESSEDIADKQNGDAHVSAEPSDEHVESSNAPVKPSKGSQAAPDNKNEAAFSRELPQSWDQADAADRLLVTMKEKNTKVAWAQIERDWERSTGEKPPKNMLSDRYRSLKDIRAHSEAGGPIGRKAKSRAVQKPSKASNDVSTLPTTRVGPTNPATGGPPDASSRAISKRSRATAERSQNPSAAPASEIASEEDLPQSWEQANTGDQLIVRMRSTRRGWERVEEAWEKLTGEKPAGGALKDRYDRIKALVIYPVTNGANTSKSLVKASTSDGASDTTISKRANPSLRTLRTRKAEAEVSEESLDESSDESLVPSSNDSSKQSKTMAPRKPRSADEQQMRDSATDGPSDAPISRAMKTKVEEPGDGRAKAGSSDVPEGIPKHPTAVAKSAQQSRGKHAVAAIPGNQETMKTADEMLVEMRERDCTWVEISKAWTDRLGLTHVPDTLRRRYARMKKGSAAKPNSTPQASSKRKMKATSPEEDLHASSSKRRKSTAETPCDPELPVKRNKDRGKQKSSVKYTESTTDEDELFAAPVEPVAAAPAKRNPGRATKVNRSDPEWLVTNEKSPLAYEDLHAEYSNPKTYENFTKSDWEDIRETLPPNIPLNPDGYSIPMTFFKYDPDFRRGIREFQEDLASGRLDPKWQADAAHAMEERAQGKFDAYKENQFEAFWGQKQKLNHDALAGESTKIKLELLIQNGIFKVGDYFSYSRVFGRGKNGVLLEKDCKVSDALDL